MDLLNLMATEADLRDKALDRLECIIALYHADDDDVQDEALARAITLCGKEWGGYKPGLEELAQRWERREDDPFGGELQALRLREEAEDPGALIRVARSNRALDGQLKNARAAIVARYGSLAAAVDPTAMEYLFIEAAAHLADPVPESEPLRDPWSPLAGWAVPWHEIPSTLAAAVSECCPLPENVTDARAEALIWDERKQERALLSDGPGTAALPTACAARHSVVMNLWRCGLPVRNGAELEARMDYWVSRGGDDGAGYAVLLADLRQLCSAGSFNQAGEGTKDRARRLKTQHPDWSLARIGSELGITRQAVHKHLKM